MKDEDKIKDLNIVFYPAGSGSMSTRLNIPIKIIRHMGISEKDRTVRLVYDENKKIITIEKKGENNNGCERF